MTRIHAHGFLRDAVLAGDDTKQFTAGKHALGWVPAERLVHRLDAFTDMRRAVRRRIRTLIWSFCADLKTYWASPVSRRYRP